MGHIRSAWGVCRQQDSPKFHLLRWMGKFQLYCSIIVCLENILKQEPTYSPGSFLYIPLCLSPYTIFQHYLNLHQFLNSPGSLRLMGISLCWPFPWDDLVRASPSPGQVLLCFSLWPKSYIWGSFSKLIPSLRGRAHPAWRWEVGGNTGEGSWWTVCLISALTTLISWLLFYQVFSLGDMAVSHLLVCLVLYPVSGTLKILRKPLLNKGIE